MIGNPLLLFRSHDVPLLLDPKHDAIDCFFQILSIIPRSIGALGPTLQLPKQERYLMTQPELEDQIAVCCSAVTSVLDSGLRPPKLASPPLPTRLSLCVRRHTPPPLPRCR